VQLVRIKLYQKFSDNHIQTCYWVTTVAECVCKRDESAANQCNMRCEHTVTVDCPCSDDSQDADSTLAYDGICTVEQHTLLA